MARIKPRMRAWYNGSTKASQALDEGSIPFARTKNQIGFIPILFLDCDVGREPEKEGSELLVVENKLYLFETYDTKGARHHLVVGIYIPFDRTKIKPAKRRLFCFLRTRFFKFLFYF